MEKHQYNTIIEWTGNKGEGTQNYKGYDRNYRLMISGKYREIQGSSDPSFLGDQTKYNPEELFLASISACHMLWYLHLCAINNIVVTDYKDRAIGILTLSENGSGQFSEVTLYPKVNITKSAKTNMANQLHDEAHRMCFIANSCNFKISHQPETICD